jgi:hypothetical protein
MSVNVRDTIAGVTSIYLKRDVRYRIIARPIAQIIDAQDNVIVESTNEWEVRELYRLIKGRSA